MRVTEGINVKVPEVCENATTRHWPINSLPIRSLCPPIIAPAAIPHSSEFRKQGALLRSVNRRLTRCHVTELGVASAIILDPLFIGQRICSRICGSDKDAKAEELYHSPILGTGDKHHILVGSRSGNLQR